VTLMHRRGFLSTLSVAACGPMAMAEPSQEGRLRAADTQSYDYPTVQSLLFIDRELRARSEHRLSLQVFAGAQLGEEGEIIQQTRAGAIDVARVNLASLADSAPLCSLLCLPGLIESDDHLSRVLAGPLGSEIANALAEIGLVLRKVDSPADMQGMRIRIQSCEVMRRMIRALGGQPVELGFSQLTSALHSGLVDGGENNIPSYVSTDQYLAAPFLSLTEHVSPPEVLVVSNYRWATMTAGQREALRSAAGASTKFMQSRWNEWTDLCRKVAEQGSVNIVPKEALGSFQEVLQGMRDTWLDESGLRRSAEGIIALAPR
jgi:TRAP-type C4-dicarboxylate transport system substrate-binding protein